VSNPQALTLEHPLDMDDARRASRRLAELRREAEDAHERLTQEAAEAEREYRKQYAQEFVAAEGTAAEREAVARARSADKAYERDLAAGMVKVQAERLRGLEGERSMLKSLVEWSARLSIDGREDFEGQRRVTA
jgi:hypothetical protein